MKRIFFLFFFFISLSLFAVSPGWIHQASISPDGKTIAFSYKGEIFTVSSDGGIANRLTSNSGYDGNPIWTPDGKRIVFLSTRDGSDDIFITSKEGGSPVRLTTHSGNETPLAFLNDSTLIFNVALPPHPSTARAPFLTNLNLLDINTSNPRPKPWLSVPVYSIAANNRNQLIMEYRKGLEDPLRKHEHSSGTTDLILYSEDKFTQLTDYDGQDKSPAWGPGNIYYYLNDTDSTMNVYEANIDTKETRQLTFFKKNPVRSLTSSSTNLLCFCQDGAVYTLKPGDKPKKVDIVVNTDFYDKDLVKRYITDGATNMAVSPDGSEIAFVVRGELYVTDSQYKTTKRITDAPAQERSMSFSPDGRSIVFDSDRDGIWTLYIASIKNPDEKSFAYSTDIEISPLYSCETSAMQPIFSPDGKKVAFLENRDEIRVIDIESKDVKTALPGKFNYSYEDGDIPFSWSPDSQWLVASYMGEMGWNNMDVAVVKADGSEIINLTESGYVNGNPKWALNGKAVTFTTGHYGMKAHASWGNQEDVMLMVLDPQAWEQFNFTKEEAEIAEKYKEEAKDKENKNKKGKSDSLDKKQTDFDFKNAKYRTIRLTPNSSLLLVYYLTPAGDKIFYVVSNADGDSDIIVSDLREKETKTFLKDTEGYFFADAKGENVYMFSPEGIGKLDLDEGELKPVEFEAAYDRHPSLERQYIFDHVAKQVEDKFYDKDLHGVDWKYYTEHYRNFLPEISNNRDFATLLSEMLGELNASHTGARYKAPGPAMTTAALGAFFNPEFPEDGLLIDIIDPQGPLAIASADLQPGDIILSIDNDTIKAGKDYYPMLEGKAGKKTRLGIIKKDGSKKFVDVRPVSPQEESEMAYRRWIERNEAIVDSLSGGKIGYVHVRGMDGPSFQNVYARMLGKYRNCDAMIVDTRYNSGGWLHNDLAVLLNGHKYVTFAPRGEEIGIEPFSQWTKPSVMLVNEANYSDAHGSPMAYKALNIGEIIGAPVPGTMTAVWWEYQIDPTVVFGIPQVTNIDNNGTVLENHQLQPDIVVYNSPELIEQGIDTQLETAVNHLLSK